MDDIEDTLQEVSVEAPSQEFDQRMEQLFTAAHEESRARPTYPFNTWQVAAACLFCVGVGFMVARSFDFPTEVSEGDEVVPEAHYTTIYIIESPSQSQRDPSVSVTGQDFWSQPMETKVIVREAPRVVIKPEDIQTLKDLGDVL